jgi:cysteine desulfurase
MIYLDYNATTPVLPDVYEEMQRFFTQQWGNPSSVYQFGSTAKLAVEKAREQVAELLNAETSEIIFTSCATESNNTALHAALYTQPLKKHIVTSSTEHSSVLACCLAYENLGYRVTRLPADEMGLISAEALEDAIEPDTAVVSLLWANTSL